MSAWWADVSTKDEARKAAMQGTWAAAVIAVVTALIAALGSKLGVPASFVDAAVFGVIAAGISFTSRTAAVIGLVLYAGETLYKFSTIGFKGIPVTVVLMIAFLNSVRGTFAYHGFGDAAPGAPIRKPVHVQPASRSALATVAVAVTIVVLGIGGYFAMQLKLQRESKGTAQLGKLPAIKVPDAPPVEQAIMMPQPKTAAAVQQQTAQPDPALEAKKKEEEQARLAAEPQIYLEPEWKMYHVAGCTAVKAGMQRLAIEKRPIDYQPHTCVPDELRRWTRKLRG